MKHVYTIMSEFGLDPSKVAITMKYILNSDLPSIIIKSDNNILSYMVLKNMDHDLFKCPIKVEVTTTKNKK